MIRLKPIKYQCCTLDDCDADAVGQFVVENQSTGIQYHLGYCGQDNHDNILTTFLMWIAAGAAVQDMPRLNKDHLFVRALGHNTVHKYSTKETLRTVCSTWEWEYRPKKWQTTKGGRRYICALPDDSILNAVLAIVAANFKRVSSKLQWTQTLAPPATYYVYSRTRLKVEQSDAHDKLEEFKDELIHRGLSSE